MVNNRGLQKLTEGYPLIFDAFGLRVVQGSGSHVIAIADEPDLPASGFG
ncbi:MAG: hypothetical protein RLZZ463_1345 [Bacteroidota bacterium]